MKNQIRQFRKVIEKFIIEDVDVIDVSDSQLDRFIGDIAKWFLKNLLPILILVLIINLTIMFTMPIEIAMSKWFWLKDPISIVIAFIFVKGVAYIKNRLQPRNN